MNNLMNAQPVLPISFNFMVMDKMYPSTTVFSANYHESGDESEYIISWQTGSTPESVEYSQESVLYFVQNGLWKILEEEEVFDDTMSLEEFFHAYIAPEILITDEAVNDEPMMPASMIFGKVIEEIVLEDDIFLPAGEMVTVLCGVVTEQFDSGMAYVVFNEQHCASATVDSTMIEVPEEYGDCPLAVCFC